MIKPLHVPFKQSGVYRCSQCGKARNTLRSVQRHFIKAHTVTVITKVSK